MYRNEKDSVRLQTIEQLRTTIDSYYQVGRKMAQAYIDQGVQQNTAMAEESAAVAEELSSQAAHLKQMLTRFKLKNAGAFRAGALEAQDRKQVPAFNWAGEPSAQSAAMPDPGSVIAPDEQTYGKASGSKIHLLVHRKRADVLRPAR